MLMMLYVLGGNGHLKSKFADLTKELRITKRIGFEDIEFAIPQASIFFSKSFMLHLNDWSVDIRIEKSN